MQYVYKYLNNRGDTVYVGITGDMERRVNEHKKDKLAEVKDPIIYYFPVKYRGDAEMLETYLIGHYNTRKHYNVAKTRKGDFSFLDIIDDFPWELYKDRCQLSTKPFVISDVVATKEVIVEKEKVVVKKEYINNDKRDAELAGYKMLRYGECLDNEIAETKKTLEMLERLQSSDGENIDQEHVEEGLVLFQRKLRILNLQKKLYKYKFIPETFSPTSQELHGLRKKRFKRLCEIARSTSNTIAEHLKN